VAPGSPDQSSRHSSSKDSAPTDGLDVVPGDDQAAALAVDLAERRVRNDAPLQPRCHRRRHACTSGWTCPSLGLTWIHLDSTIHMRPWWTRARPRAFLGVKVATLYSYASRHGALLPLRSSTARKRYLRDDLERLRHRADARLGHEAVAAGPLRWAKPVLSSALTEIRPDGPCTAATPVLDLARTARFEAVAELLWTGTLPRLPPAGARPRALLAAVPRAPGAHRRADRRLSAVRLPAASERRIDERGQGRARARVAVRRSPHRAAPPSWSGPRRLVAASACGRRPRSASRRRPRRRRGPARARAPRGGARLLEARWWRRPTTSSTSPPSPPGSRRSTGADVEACLLAALGTFSGPRHWAEGIACRRWSRRRAARAARSTLLARIVRGEALPGFGHRLYRPEIRGARSSSRSPCGRAAHPAAGHAAGARWRRRRGWTSACPTSTWGSSRSRTRCVCSLGEGQGPLLLGRSAGWIAHVAEQRSSGSSAPAPATWAPRPSSARAHQERGDRVRRHMQTLQGKTLFITGGSRGIGLAIALRARPRRRQRRHRGEDDRASPQAAGTLYTAAEEIEKAGGGHSPAWSTSASRTRSRPRWRRR
jgi:citrate synthase